jgi:MFS family permease
VTDGDEEIPREPFRPPRGMWRLLADPVFGPFFLGKLLSTTGVWIHNIVAAVLVLQLTGSALAVGAVTAAQFIPQLFAPWSGALADRGNQRRQVVVGRLIAGSGSAALACWVALAGEHGLPGAWPVIAIGFYVGIGFVVGAPAMQALLPTMVRPGELPLAIALNSIPFTAARAGGPALGAFAAVAAGPAAGFALAAAGNFAFALIMFRLPLDRPPAAPPGSDRSVRAGLRLLRTDRPLRLLLLAVAMVGLGSDPALTLTPSLSVQLGNDLTLVGAFASAFGIGAAVGVPVLAAAHERVPLAWQASVGLWLLGLSALGVAFSTGVLLVAVMFGVGGLGLTLSVTALSTLVQMRAPQAVRGRIMALWLVAFVGSRPLAAGLNGLLADLASVRVALVVTAVLVLGVAVRCHPSHLSGPPPPQVARI